MTPILFKFRCSRIPWNVINLERILKLKESDIYEYSKWYCRN